jgi:hypothetical protein
MQEWVLVCARFSVALPFGFSPIVQFGEMRLRHEVSAPIKTVRGEEFAIRLARYEATMSGPTDGWKDERPFRFANPTNE